MWKKVGGLTKTGCGDGSRKSRSVIIEVMEKDGWNEKATHPLQSWEWGEFRSQRQKISRIADFLIIWTRIKTTNYYFGYCPMSRIPNENEILSIKQEAIINKGIAVRFEPNVLRDKTDLDLQKKFFYKGRPLFKPKTYWWDLTKSEEELLKAMHPKGRYNIKVAQKHGVIVKEDDSDAAFNTYLDLMFEGTAKRQKIYAHSKTYHQQMWKFLKGNLAHLWVAELENKIIAADLIFAFKDKLYYAYSASALEHKETMPTTLLLWEIARWGKKRGYKVFDLWGAEEGKGFSRFKEQFGAELVETVGTYDLPVNTRLYKIFRAAEELRWRILRILK